MNRKIRRAAARQKKKIRKKAERDARRDWAELPVDVLSIIFQKLGVVDVLLRAQRICRNWNIVSHNPAIWRVVDMRGYCKMQNPRVFNIQRAARMAVDRAAGSLEAYYAHGKLCGSVGMLSYIAERNSTLKCLVLISCRDISDEALIEFVTRFTMLEEVEITLCRLSHRLYESLGQLCPHMKHFRLNTTWCKVKLDDMAYDEDALAIANTMHQLRSLQVVGNQLTDKGLLAVLDNCPQLESLDIRCCYNVNMDNCLELKLARIKKVMFPDDPTSHYEYAAEEEDSTRPEPSSFAKYKLIAGAGGLPQHIAELEVFADIGPSDFDDCLVWSRLLHKLEC